jgi:hypothetical protein
MSQGLLQMIIQLCLKRIQVPKMATLQFKRCTLWLVALLVGKFGGSAVVGLLDGMQEGLFKMLMNRLLSDVGDFIPPPLATHCSSI